METQGLQDYPHVVLVPAPFQGHISPMLELGAALHSKGFSIIVAHTNFNSPDTSHYPEFIFLPIADNLSEHEILPGDIFALIKTINNNCEQPLRESLSELMIQGRENDIRRIVCIIYDTAMYFSDAVASHLKVPAMNFRTSGASSDVAFLEIPRLIAEGYIPREGTFPNSCLKYVESTDFISN